MPANKTLTSAQNHLTGMARSHKEPTALWRIIWTSANPDPVGAGHACEQGSTLRRKLLHGHGPLPPKADGPAHRRIQRVTAAAPPLHKAPDRASACAPISSPSATDRTPVPAPARYGNAR